MQQDDHSAKIRNYTIAGFFIVLTILAIIFIFMVFKSTGSAPVNIWSECRNESANVFIGANEELKNVQCTALDTEFIASHEIFIGDLSKNDEDVCRFKLSKNATGPLRFEVRYNNEVKREVCAWQYSAGYLD